MTTVTVELPDDIEALKTPALAARSKNAAFRAAKADADARNERLHAWLKALERARYGRRSEALDPDQHAFAFVEVETGIGAAEAALDAPRRLPPGTVRRDPPSDRRGRSAMHAWLRAQRRHASIKNHLDDLAACRAMRNEI